MAASLLGGPPGAACEPARRGLLICIAVAAAAARGTGAAVPGASSVQADQQCLHAAGWGRL